MATRKSRSYTRIIDYIEDIYPGLYEVLHSLNVENLLMSNSSRPGVTFLLPTDLAFVQQLREWTDSGEEQYMEQAVMHIRACIVYESLSSVSTWKHLEEAVNSLRQNLDVDQRSASTTEIRFKCTGKDGAAAKDGVSAVVDGDFRDVCRKENLHIWLLRGKIPVDLKDAKSKPAKRTKGSGVVQKPVAPPRESIRFALSAEIEATYAYRRLHEPGSCEYRDFVVGFLAFLLQHRERKMANETLYERVLPVLSRQWPSDFYLVFETMIERDDYLIQEAILEEYAGWRRRRPKVDFAATLAAIDKMYSAYSGKTEYPAIYSNRIALLNAVDDIRRDLLDRSYVDMVVKCADVYTKAIDDNTLGDVKNILPGAILELYRKSPGRKLWEDEIRQYLLLEFNSLSQATTGDFISQYSELKENIAEYFGVSATSSETRRLKLFNVDVARYRSSEVNFLLCSEIVLSSNFFHFGLSKSNLTSEEFPHEEFTTARPSPSKPEYWNIEALTAKRNDRVATTQTPPTRDTIQGIDKFLRKYADAPEEVRKMLTDAKNLAEKSKSPVTTSAPPAPHTPGTNDAPHDEQRKPNKEPQKGKTVRV